MTSRTNDNFRQNFWTWVDPPPVWTMFKKTSLFWKEGIPNLVSRDFSRNSNSRSTFKTKQQQNMICLIYCALSPAYRTFGRELIFVSSPRFYSHRDVQFLLFNLFLLICAWTLLILNIGRYRPIIVHLLHIFNVYWHFFTPTNRRLSI